MLGKLPVPGRPTNLDYSRTRAYFDCSRCGYGLFGHFFSILSLLFSFSLSQHSVYSICEKTAGYVINRCLQTHVPFRG